MGFTVKFNWALQIEVPKELKENASFTFSKEGNRVFPINIPIDLIDKKRNAIAKIRILEFSNQQEVTTGIFEVIKIYKDIEKQILTNYWKENE